MPPTTTEELRVTIPKRGGPPPGATLDDVISAFHQARAEVASLFALAGLDPTKTRESARELGISRGLTWRLTRMIRESDPSLVVAEVPGAASMGKFFDACRDRGAPDAAIVAASDRLNDFERALSACSGDRKTLAMLMANRGEATPRTETDKARRKLFEGACGVWGAQAQTRFVTVFVFPSPGNPDKLDAGHVSGFVGFRRLSPRPWPLYHEAVHDAAGAPVSFTKEPLDPAGVTEGQAQLMKAYCSPTTPTIDVVRTPGYKRFELATGPVGNEGLTTVVFGTRLRTLYDRYADEPNTAGFMVLLNTPVERVIFDMFVHRDLGVTTPPRVHLLDRLAFPHSNVESDFDRQSLHIAESPDMLPRGVSGALHPVLPWYSSLVQDVAARLDQSVDDFIGSRFEMAYPPVCTTLSRRFDIGPKPR